MIVPDHNKISVTAKLVAYYRGFSDIPFAKDVSRLIEASQAFEKLAVDSGIAAEQILEFAPIFEIRYKSIVTLIRNSGIRQVLELASGFSLRGLAMARDEGYSYVESDLDDLTSEKTQIIHELGIDYPLANGVHHFASVNALDFDQLRAATSSFDRNKPLVVVNEGLIQYFSVAERQTLARNVRRLLGEFAGGIWITPDFTVKSDIERVSVHRERLRQAVMGMTDRKLYESAFDTQEQMDAFFAELGFAATLHHQLDLTPHLASIQNVVRWPYIQPRLRERLKIWELRSV